MYTISRIHSLIKPAMCGTFQRHVDACEADKYSKKFSCHELLVTMLFATFSNSKSLRILEQRFNAHPTGHYHLHTHAIHRSTLSYALAQKDITPFIAFAQGLMQSTDRKLRRESKTRWCPKMYADKRRANKKQRRHGIFEVWKLKIPFAVPVAVGRI